KAASIAIPDDRGSDEELLKHLSARSGIVVLDNCEHLERDIERWIVALLDRAPALRVLATSQEAFHHKEAVTYRLEALAIPDRDASAEQIRASAAISLLERRAQTENHRYRIDDAELANAAALCRELDGIPLAIEMAAVRLPTLGIAGLNERLSDRIRLFRNKYPDAPTRQQSLRSALDWSVSLLSEDERTLFFFLTEFVGGFGLPTVQLLAPHIAHDEIEVLDTLDSLVGKSLVHVASADPLRYRISETARIYAGEQLRCSELRDRSRKAHAQVMSDIAMQARRELTEINDDPWLASYFPDYENAELALAYGATHRDAAVVAATVQFLISLDDVRSIISPNMRERIRLAYEASENAKGIVRAMLMSAVATTPHIADPILPRKEAARLAVDAWKDQGDNENLAYAWARYAYNCASTNDLDAAREAVRAYEAVDSGQISSRTRLRIERLLAATSSYCGDALAMISHLQRALELTEVVGAKRRAAILLVEIGDAYSIAEQYDQAVHYGERSIRVLKELGLARGLRYAYSNTIAALCFTGSLDRAIEYARASLAPEIAAQKFDIQGDPFGMLCALRNDHEVAAKFIGASDAWYEVAGYAREPMEKRTRERCVEICERVIGKDRFEKARS
ncbi:MAG: ATP-binding protein, partial [Casimicrobium sp.]